VNGKESGKSAPKPVFDLIWDRTFAAIARSADFGYTTGREMEGEQEGGKISRLRQFVSIWKKQKDGRGRWRSIVN